MVHYGGRNEEVRPGSTDPLPGTHSCHVGRATVSHLLGTYPHSAESRYDQVNRDRVGYAIEQIAPNDDIKTIRVRRIFRFYYLVIVMYDGTVRFILK